MQRTDNIKYVSVKCYNQPLNYKNVVHFQNSLISDKTRIPINYNNNNQQLFQPTKVMRIHTEGSQSYNIKQKNGIKTFLKNDIEKNGQQSLKINKSKQQQQNLLRSKKFLNITTTNAPKKALFKQSTQNQNNIITNNTRSFGSKMVGNYHNNNSNSINNFKQNTKIQRLKTQPCNNEVCYYSIYNNNNNSYRPQTKSKQNYNNSYIQQQNPLNIQQNQTITTNQQTQNIYSSKKPDFIRQITQQNNQQILKSSSPSNNNNSNSNSNDSLNNNNNSIKNNNKEIMNQENNNQSTLVHNKSQQNFQYFNKNINIGDNNKNTFIPKSKVSSNQSYFRNNGNQIEFWNNNNNNVNNYNTTNINNNNSNNNQKIKTSIKKTNDLFKSTNNNLQKKSKQQYFRKSFKTNIRKTQNNDQSFIIAENIRQNLITGSNNNINNQIISNRYRYTTADCLTTNNDKIDNKSNKKLQDLSTNIIFQKSSRSNQKIINKNKNKQKQVFIFQNKEGSGQTFNNIQNKNSLDNFLSTHQNTLNNKNRYSQQTNYFNVKKTSQSFQKNIIRPDNTKSKSPLQKQNQTKKSTKNFMRLKTQGDNTQNQNKVFIPSYILKGKIDNSKQNHKQKQKPFQQKSKNSKILNKSPQQKQKPTNSPPTIDWKKDLTYLQKIGQGTFGKVYKAKLKQSIYNNNNSLQQQKIYAVKKVYIDKKYKSRQLQIVNQIQHINIMRVYNVFISNQSNDQYLNIVMDYYQKNLYQVINQNSNHKKFTNMLGNNSANSLTFQSDFTQKVLIYQMFKGLNYIHSKKICHRDIKPHNMLVKNWQLALCDFGSAKKLIQGQSNLSYICSRCYRAPELIFGSTQYTTKIDLWSAACVILQILHKSPLFIGQSSLDHLLQVIKILGTPTKKQVLAMNKDYDITQYDLPLIKRKTLSRLFPKTDTLLIDLLNKLLVYDPSQRLNAFESLNHAYFDQLKKDYGIIKLKNYFSNKFIINLFNFTQDQIKNVSQTRKLTQFLTIKQKAQRLLNDD